MNNGSFPAMAAAARLAAIVLLCALVGGCVGAPTGNRMLPGDYVMNLAQAPDAGKNL